MINRQKWIERWEKEKVYESKNNSSKKPCFVCDMFPYPSGNSMHVGHPRGFVATDIYSRYKRMSGYNVLHPMGWDTFGLPAEETAIENKEHPNKTIERNIKKFKKQLKSMGLGYDWDREVITSDKEYYKHTQRLFLEFFRRGLTENKKANANWCPELGTVLSNEDIVNGKSERGGHDVFLKPIRQWTLKITKYAGRLLKDLDKLDWPEKIKNAQEKWIGESVGHTVVFECSSNKMLPSISTFTTRLETLPGVTFLSIAPDSQYTEKIIENAKNKKEIEDYIFECSKKTNDQTKEKEKSGHVIDGVSYTNPLTKKEVPIVVSDYVLSSYGTGAVMGVPGHDERDRDAAELFSFPIVEVTSKGHMSCSGDLNGLSVSDCIKKITGKLKITDEVQYKIRDWVFSRQRFWGEPFPVVWVEGEENYKKFEKNKETKQWIPETPVTYSDGDVTMYAVPVSPKFLSAVELPDVDSYENTNTIEGPLAGMPEWVNTFINTKTGEVSNDKEGNDWVSAKRDTNTMPQWAGSSWYWLRYMDPQNKEEPFSKSASKYWGPVNLYSGADHAVAHLIYARFWQKVMCDAGMIDFDEPFLRLEFLGHVLASDGQKISKRKGNSVSPDEVIDTFGADAFRMYEMMLGPFQKSIPWDDNGPVGALRFIERIRSFVERNIKDNKESDKEAVSDLHKLIEKIERGIEKFRFNVVISDMMKYVNKHTDSSLSVDDTANFLKLLAPVIPFEADELYEKTGSSTSIHTSDWPKYDKSKVLKETLVSIPVQVNGKKRAEVEVSPEITDTDLEEVVLSNENVKRHTKGQSPKKFIRIKNQIINIVV